MDVSHEDKSIPTPVVEFRHLTDKGVPSKGTPLNPAYLGILGVLVLYLLGCGANCEQPESPKG